MLKKICDTLLKKNRVVLFKSQELNLLFGSLHYVAQVEQGGTANLSSTEKRSQLVVLAIASECNSTEVLSKIPTKLQSYCQFVDLTSDPLGWNSVDAPQYSVKTGLFNIVKTSLEKSSLSTTNASNETARLLIICDSLSLFVQNDAAQLYRDLAKLVSLNYETVSLLCNVRTDLHSEADLLVLEKQCDAVIHVKSCVADDDRSKFDYDRSSVIPDKLSSISKNEQSKTLTRCYDCDIAYRSSMRRETKRRSEVIGVQVNIESSAHSIEKLSLDNREVKFKLIDVRRKKTDSLPAKATSTSSSKPSNAIVTSANTSTASSGSQSAVKANAPAAQPTKRADELEALSTSEREARSRVRLPFEFSEAEKRETLERERRLREGEAVNIDETDMSGASADDPDADLYR